MVLICKIKQILHSKVCFIYCSCLYDFLFKHLPKMKLSYLFWFILNCKWNSFWHFCFCFQVNKYRPHVTSTVLARGSFIDAIVASVSNFTNNKWGLKPYYITCRFSINSFKRTAKNDYYSKIPCIMILFAMLF